MLSDIKCKQQSEWNLKNICWFSAEQKNELKKLSNGQNTPQKLALRSDIVLMAAEGHRPGSISGELHVVRATANRWIDRWLMARESGLPVATILDDEPRSGAPGTFTPMQLCQLFASLCSGKPGGY